MVSFHRDQAVNGLDLAISVELYIYATTGKFARREPPLTFPVPAIRCSARGDQIVFPFLSSGGLWDFRHSNDSFIENSLIKHL